MTPRFDVQPSIAAMRFSPLRSQKFIIMQELAMVKDDQGACRKRNKPSEHDDQPRDDLEHRTSYERRFGEGDATFGHLPGHGGQDEEVCDAADDEKAAHKKSAGQNNSMGVDESSQGSHSLQQAIGFAASKPGEAARWKQSGRHRQGGSPR